jgi:hypothetical protein
VSEAHPAHDTGARAALQSRSAISPSARAIGSVAALRRAAIVVAAPLAGGFIGTMPKRLILLTAAAAAAMAIAAGPAAATDNPAPGVQPGTCVDSVKPTSSFSAKSARRAIDGGVLRGIARDSGCGVNRVAISLLVKKHGKCRNLTGAKKLGRRISCSKRHWLPAAGSSRWSFRVPKKLPKGRYVIRTRAVDFAGNVESQHGRRLRLR